MPHAGATHDAHAVRSVAKRAMLGGLAILLLKLAVFKLTNSVAVLADAADSVVNLIAAVVMLYGLWLTSRGGREFSAEGGKAEYLAVGFEGWLILILGLLIGYLSVERLIHGDDPANQPRVDRLTLGLWLLAGVATLTLLLGTYAWMAARRYDSALLQADALHLFADVASTLGVMLGLGLLQGTGENWLDPVFALLVTAVVLWTSWRLMWKSVLGLTEELEREVNPTLIGILDAEKNAGRIADYGKVRYRFNGPFRWIEFHIKVDPSLTIARGRELAAQIEKRVKAELDNATVFVQVEPYEGELPKQKPEAAETPTATPPPNEAETHAEGVMEADASADPDDANPAPSPASEQRHTKSEDTPV